MEGLTLQYKEYQESIKEEVGEMVKSLEDNHKKELLKVDVVNNKLK